MGAAVQHHAASADVIVMAAAVADFKPAERGRATRSRRKTASPRSNWCKTHDILGGLGASKRPGQILVGFAAETDDVVANAAGKLQRKNLDLIVANDVSAPGVGFDHDTNAVTLISSEGPILDVPLSSKHDVARALLDAVVVTST